MGNKIFKLLIYLLVQVFLCFSMISVSLSMEGSDTIPDNSMYSADDEPHYFLGGAIAGISCDPLADPVTDLADPELNFQSRTSFEDCKKIGDKGCVRIDEGKDLKDYRELQSCVRQGIDLDNFKLLVQAESQVVFGFLQATAISLALMSVPGSKALVAIVTTCQALSLLSTGFVERNWLSIYQRKGMLGGICPDIVDFEVRLEGDKACVYAKALFILEFPVKRHDSYSTEHYEDKSKYPKHCVYVPPKKIGLKKPEWSPLISPVCTHYQSSASIREHPISAIVSQCIEDTMMNIFTIKDHNGLTFFGKMQERMKTIIKALLTLYVVMIGFKLMIEKKVNRPEATFFAIKIAVVWYFAIGGGMNIILPAALDLSKTLSKIVLDAGMGLGSKDDYEREMEVLDELQEDYNRLRIVYIDARRVYQFSEDERDSDSEAKSNMEQAKKDLYKAEKALNQQRSVIGSFGYNYCDYRQFDYTYVDEEPYYTGTSLETRPRTRNMKLVSMWDTIDCKIEKILGIGEIPGASLVPYSIVFALAIVISTPLGILIMILFLSLILFLLLVTLRIIQMYVIAIVAIFILCFFAPLFFPAMLFSFTRNIFQIWTKQLIAFTIQPVIVVAFLTLLLGVYDQIFYGKNHFFYPSVSYHYDDNEDDKTGDIIRKADGSLASDSDAFYANKMILSPDPLFPSDRSKDTCEDPYKLGCIYNKTIIDSYDFPIEDPAGNTGGTGGTIPDIGFVWPFVDISLQQANMITLDLLKLIFISAIFFSAMDVITSIATRLTDSAAGGIGGLASMPVPPVEKIAGGITKGTLGIAKTPGALIDGIAKGIGRKKSAGGKEGKGGTGKQRRKGGSTSSPNTMVSASPKKGIKNE